MSIDRSENTHERGRNGGELILMNVRPRQAEAYLIILLLCRIEGNVFPRQTMAKKMLAKARPAGLNRQEENSILCDYYMKVYVR